MQLVNMICMSSNNNSCPKNVKFFQRARIIFIVQKLSSLLHRTKVRQPKFGLTYLLEQFSRTLEMFNKLFFSTKQKNFPSFYFSVLTTKHILKKTKSLLYSHFFIFFPIFYILTFPHFQSNGPLKSLISFFCQHSVSWVDRKYELLLQPLKGNQTLILVGETRQSKLGKTTQFWIFFVEKC